MGVNEVKALARAIGTLVVRASPEAIHLEEAERHHPLVVEAALEATQEVLRGLPPGNYYVAFTPQGVKVRKG